MDSIELGENVILLAHPERKRFKVYGLQFIYTNHETEEGELHYRLMIEAYGHKWLTLVKESDIERITNK